MVLWATTDVLLLVLGMFLESISVLIVVVPLLMPVVTTLGIDPIHFGLVVVLNLMIGLLTPPVGYLLYMSAEMAAVPVERVIREVTPLLLALLAVLAISTYWPGLVMFLPNAFR